MKIALIGYGKMGHAIEEIALKRGHEIVCCIDRDNTADFASQAFAQADIAIEFTTPATAVDNYYKAFAAGKPVVSGTTGWLERLPEIKEACQHGNTLFYASNFSLGVNIFFAMNRWLASVMNHFDNYRASLEEIHHIHKLDHPSGTAITLAEELIANTDKLSQWSEEKTGNDILPVTAIRRGEEPGTHIIRYESDADVITIEHRAKSREGFALGAVLATEFTIGKHGWLTMKDMLPFLQQ